MNKHHDEIIIQRLKIIEQLQEREQSFEYSRNLGEVYAEFLSLPGLVGFWTLSSVQRSTGNAYDISGQGRTLTYNGNPTYSIYNSLVPYIDLDGAGDFLSRADETDLDILGSEAIYASAARGLTLGGWFYSTVAGAPAQGLATKWNGIGNQRSYRIIKTAGNAADCSVSGTGADTFTATSAATFTANIWHFVCGRFTPSTEVAIFIDGIKTTFTTGIPAAIFNSTQAFEIGRTEGSLLLTGRAGPCFLCANALSDLRLQRLFNVTRSYFGV